MSKRVLVTGGSGFIGKFLVERLVSKGFDVKSLSSKDCDIRDAEQVKSVFDGFRPEVVFHLAGLTGFSLAYQDLFEVNVKGTENVLTCSKGCEKVVFVSSAGVYGGNEVPFCESMQCEPLNDYFKTKLLAEKVCLDAGNAVVVRLPIIYGPGHKGTSFLLALHNAVKNNEKFVMESPRDVTRDFLHVNDLMCAMLKIVENDVNGEIINLGSGKEVCLGEVVDIVSEKYGLDVECLDIDKNESKSYYLDSSRAEELLGWKANVSLEEGLNDVFE
jgi:nucleoside-diphosphate-sugar epimerase